MAFRSRRTLEAWIEEFLALGYPIAGSIRVMPQDGADGADTGLVGVRLAHASTITYVQPESPNAKRWVATMEARDEAVLLDSAELLSLAGELAVVSALCAFLQTKSADFTDVDTP